MHFSSQTIAFLLLACVVHAGPVDTTPTSNGNLHAREDKRGSYTVSGLGSRKQAILNAGGNTLDLAIAMLETEKMQTNYVYGRLLDLVLLALKYKEYDCSNKKPTTSR